MRYIVQKNRKHSTSAMPARPSRRGSIAIPDIVTIDVMGATPDEELINRLRSLEEDRQKVLDTHQDPRPWEEEVAYIRRELQIRRERRAAHERYVRQLEKEYVESEANLPVADLDNTHFLRLVGEIN